jgi:hypothetical protein
MEIYLRADKTRVIKVQPAILKSFTELKMSALSLEFKEPQLIFFIRLQERV